jgi:hypothetical protein
LSVPDSSGFDGQDLYLPAVERQGLADGRLAESRGGRREDDSADAVDKHFLILGHLFLPLLDGLHPVMVYKLSLLFNVFDLSKIQNIMQM